MPPDGLPLFDSCMPWLASNPGVQLFKIQQPATVTHSEDRDPLGLDAIDDAVHAVVYLPDVGAAHLGDNMPRTRMPA